MHSLLRVVRVGTSRFVFALAILTASRNPLPAQVTSPAPVAGKGVDSARTATSPVPVSGRTMRATRRHGPIVLDGRLDEPDWLAAPVATAFVQQMPHDGAAASERTEVRILYDDDALYVGARMYDPHPDSLIAPVTRRDAMDTPTDAFTVDLDSYRDRRTSF